MDDPARHYWNTIGASKEFTHPVDLSWLAGIGRDSRVLDYGCGYGRVVSLLVDAGFGRVCGADVSAALIERGRALRPGLDLRLIAAPPVLDVPDGSFDVVMLFAVLTCVPADADQVAVVAELDRVLVPGGLIYVSDLLLQGDERSLRRYAQGSPYGVFTGGDGAIFRHHSAERLRGLFEGFPAAGSEERFAETGSSRRSAETGSKGRFAVVGERRVPVVTMNGNPAEGLQLLVRKVGGLDA